MKSAVLAQEAMKWAVGAGIIKGKDNGTLLVLREVQTVQKVLR